MRNRRGQYEAFHQKKGLAWIGVILGALFLAAGGVALWRAGQAKDVLDQITEPASSQREVGVYVLEEDPAQDLAQTAGYRYGGLEEEAFPALEQALGEPPDWQRYPTAFALADALEKGERQAVVLEEAYQKSLSDARGYEWALTGMRLVGTVPVEKAPAPSLPAPEGTPQQFLLYLSGSDTFGDVSTLARSDVNILAAVNTQTKELLLVATPRDFYLSFPQTGGAMDKLTHAGVYGIDASVAALEGLYGVDISYYVKMNFTGFVEVIDALGGVPVYSDREFTVENIRTYQEGYNQLTGIEALAFARELLGNLSGILEAVEGNFQTNLPQSQILALAPTLAGDWDIRSLTVSGESAYRETYSMPGSELYVILPDESSVEDAACQIQEVLGGSGQSGP